MDNKCRVEFPCSGGYKVCSFYVLKQVPDGTICHNGCISFDQGYCTNREAQIEVLKSEGFEIKDVEN